MSATCAVDGCEKRRYGRGFCRAHLERWRRHGDPTVVTRRLPGEVAGLVQAAATDPLPGPCTILANKKNARTVTRLDGVHMWASRAVWVIANGDPGSLFVLHTCSAGMQGCIRLAHLYLGTAADNGRDKVQDGNSSRGERNASALLTRDDVRAIRRLIDVGVTQAQIAAMFGVSHHAVSDIRRGKSWGWLPEFEESA